MLTEHIHINFTIILLKLLRKCCKIYCRFNNFVIIIIKSAYYNLRPINIEVKFLGKIYSSFCKKIFYSVGTTLRKSYSQITSFIKNFNHNLIYRTTKDKIIDIAKSFRSEAGAKITIFASLLTICFLICIFTCSFGYKVTANGRTLGIIASKQMYEQIYNGISENVFNMTGKPFTTPAEPKLTLAFALNRNFLSEEQFAENLKSISSEMIPAYTVVIDDKMVVALPGKEMAEDAVNEYKNAFSSGIKDATLDFANEVEICYMFAPKDILRSKDGAVNLLLNGEFSHYQAEENTTVSEISKKTGISESTILKSNSIEGETVLKNQVIKLYSGRMFADVFATHHVKREESIPFETVSQTSEEMYQGIRKIQKEGTDGIKFVDELVTYINGIEIQRDILHESVLKSPISQVELVGTKEAPPSVGTGTLTMPTSGSLSSRFGSRWGRKHEGIDLSAGVGTPIYAADNGKVIYAQYNNGGYGYMVQIDHGNGLKTYYAHCNELLVNEGDIVAKGDLIAKVGNTGRSTGAHLHFEVRQNDVPIDPFDYMN